jgi:hypothetical protein
MPEWRKIFEAENSDLGGRGLGAMEVCSSTDSIDYRQLEAAPDRWRTTLGVTLAFYILQILQISERTNSREDTFHLRENAAACSLRPLG